MVLKFLCVLMAAASLSHGLHAARKSDSASLSDRIFSVLIATPPPPGHAFPMLALGEELARRGHNVTFCTTHSWWNIDKKAVDKGMNILSAGDFPFNENTMTQTLNMSFALSLELLQSLPKVMAKFRAMTGTIVEFLERVDLRQWDIIVVDSFLAYTVPCLAHQAGVPVIGVAPRNVLPHLLPEWPFPREFTFQTDDLSFTNRVVGFLQYLLLRSALCLVNPLQLSSTNGICNVVFHSSNPLCVEFPCFFKIPIGLEFSRTTTPLEHSVGPMLSKQNVANFSEELSVWLSGKSEKEVIYVSMGSGFLQTHRLAQAVVNGLQSTRYSVIWSLKQINRNILDGLNVDSSRFFISNWIPQNQLLQHPAIAMAIIHGGSGGVLESLYNAIPIIVIPFGGDQLGTAARVVTSGVGVALELSQLTAEQLRESVQKLEHRNYRRKAQQMRKIFIQAGGVDRASDLVELYADVGYQHLMPAYIKYKWSWVQYYNVDVKLLLCVLTAGVLYCTSKLCMCCCHQCCCCCWCGSGTKKNKTE